MSKLYTPPFRVSFPHLFEPTAFTAEDGSTSKPKYEVTMLFSKKRLKENPEELKLFKAMQKEAKDLENSKWSKKPKKLNRPFGDGAEKEELDGYSDDIIFIKVKSEIKPGVLNEKGKRITKENQEDFYAGCWAIATINGYTYDMKVNKGVAFGLANIKKVEDDEPFGSRTTPEQDFGIEELDEDSAEGDFAEAPESEDEDDLDSMFT